MRRPKNFRAFGLVIAAFAIVVALVATQPTSGSASFVSLTIPSDPEADPIEISALGYADAAAALAPLTGTPLAVDFPGMPAQALDSFTLDPANETIVFSGSASVMLLATWNGSAQPEIVFAVDAGSRALSTLGLSGHFSDTALPRVVLFQTADGNPAVLPAATLPAAASSFLGGLYPGASLGQVSLSGGLDFASRLDLAALPAPLASALGGGDVLIAGSLGNNDFGMLSGSLGDTSSFSLIATLPSLSAALPDWLSLTQPTLSLTAAGGSITGALALHADASVGGSNLSFEVNATLDFGSKTTSLQANLAAPWVAPFGVPWLTLDATSLLLEVDSAGAVDASLHATVGAGAATVDLSVILAGGEATLTGSVASLTSADLAALLGGHAGVAAPGGLPDLALNNLTVEVDTASEAFSVFGDVSVFGVQGSILVSALDRGDGRELLLGIAVASTTLGDLPLGLTGAPAAVTLPNVAFAFVDAPGALAVAASEMTAAEQAFFSGRFGFTGDPGSQVSLVSGLNLEADLPLSELPTGVVDALGLDGTGALLLSGSLAISGGSVSAASLDASFPGTPTIAGMPSWFQGDPAEPFALRIEYDGSVGTFGVSAGFLLTPDGVDTVPFAVSLEVATDGSVGITGASTAGWDTPFDQQWLSLDSISLDVNLAPGGESSASLSSSFMVGSTTFTLDVSVTGEAGNVNASFSATADQITDEDLVTLIAATGAETSGLSLPDIVARDLVLSVTAGTGGFSFEVGGKVDLFGQTSLDLVLALVADAGGGFRVVGGIQATDLSLSDLAPDTAGTFAGDLTLESLALVLSVGGESVSSDDLSPVLRGFFDTIYGTDEYEVDLGSGVTLLAAASVPAELTAVTDALGGLTVSNLVISGSLGIPWGGGASAPAVSLKADIPRLEFASGGPDWFRYAALEFSVEANATTGKVEVRLGGELGVTIDDGEHAPADLTFLVDGELKAGPTGVQFALGGSLATDAPWERPFGIEWLVINNLSIYLSFDATTQGFGLELGGDVVLGTAPHTKQLAITIGLELNVATGIPTNFVFQGTSTSHWGLQDLLTLYSYLDPAGGEVLDDIPDLQIRPVDEDTPIEVRFALKNSPNVSAGFALRGSLWVELVLNEPLEEVAVLDVEVGTAGVFLEGASSIPIVLGVATLTNVEFDLDWAFVPADFSFFAAADLESDLFGNTRLVVQVPFDVDFNTLLEQTLADLQNIEQIWADLKPLLASDPIASLNSDTIRDLYAAVDQPVPAWVDELLTAIDALPNLEGVPGSPIGLVNAVLGGFTLSVPPGSGYPTGGVESGTCAPLATGPGGYCYITLPSSGVEQGFKTIQVCDFAIYEAGECWIVPPSITIDAPLQTFCPTGFLEQGKCWLVPPSITTTVAPVQGCTDFLAILEGGRCWTVPPSVTWELGYAFGVCLGIESGGKCWGVPPGPPVLSGNSWPTNVCPGLTIPSGGKCYETVPGPPLLSYPSTPITGCIPPLIEAGGSCWSPIPGPPTKANTSPYPVQVCELPGIVQDGKCWKFGQTPSAGLPVGGFEPGCPIWAPFYVDGECWTIPPTPEVQLITFDGLCHVLDIACSLDGLIEDTIIRPIVNDIQQDLTPFLVPSANADPVADAGGPYSVPEGDSVAVSAAGSWDADGDALSFAWDLDNDGLFDDGSNVSATFSAAGVDGPSSRTIGVRVTDAVGNTSIDRVSVHVTNVAPVLAIDGPASVDEMAPYTLTLSATDPGTETLSWAIDWGDGGTSTASGNHATLTHQFTGNPLNPTITVTASDEDGDYSAGRLAVTVIAVSPTITASITSPIDEGGVATLTGTIVEPGGDDALAFTVDWGDGHEQTFHVSAGSTSYVFTHRYADDPPGSPDVYQVHVEAVNEDGLSDDASTSVTVRNVAPVVDLQGGTGEEGREVSLLGLIRDPGLDDTFTVTVDWGDGTVETHEAAADDRALGYVHTYTEDGEYAVLVRVTDDDGGVGEASTAFEIANVAPRVSGLAASPVAIDEDDEVTLSGSIVEPGADPVTLVIDWGDGTAESFNFAIGEEEFSLVHRYLDDRQGSEDLYPIHIAVADDDGGETESTTELGVANVRPSDVRLLLSAASIDEGDEVTLTGRFVDPGSLDTFTVKVDWGDGSEPSELSLAAGARSFEVSHVYVDDDPTGTAADQYTIEVTVTDDDLGSGTGETVIGVANVAPSAVDLSVEAGTIDEDGTAVLHGTFADPGADDTFTVSIDWGDGSEPSVLSLDAGARDFEATHRYLDDNPTGTSADVYTITVEVLDDDTGSDAAAIDITVENVAAVLTGSPMSKTILSTQTHSIGVTFTDEGTLDTHTAVIDWGDGEQEPVLVEQGAGSGSLGGSHRYVDSGMYVITVSVTDDDGGVSVLALELEVLGPQDLKEQATALLAPHQGVRRVGQAIGLIEDSLDTALWQDVLRPDDDRGHSVFDRESQAARLLDEALRKDGARLGAAGRAAVAEALDLLVTADWIIVRVGWVDTEALPDAIQASRAKQVERELHAAEEDYAEAQAHQAAGRHEDAIDAYRSAWQHLDRAFQHAGLR